MHDLQQFSGLTFSIYFFHFYLKYTKKEREWIEVKTQSSDFRGGFQKTETVNLGLLPKLGGGGQGRFKGPNWFFCDQKCQNNESVLTVTPLFWAIEDQNEWEKKPGPKFRGGGARKVSAEGPDFLFFFFEASP